MLGLAGTHLVLVAGAPWAGAESLLPLVVSQEVGQAVLGSPVTVSLTVSAPSDRPAAGLVITESLPACTTLVPASVAPASITVTTVAAGAGGGPCAAGSTLVFRDLGDVLPGAAVQLNFEVRSSAALGTPLAFQAAASATDDAAHEVPVDASGVPVLGAAAGWLEAALPVQAGVDVTAFGVTETDSGAPAVTSVADAAGLVTGTVAITEAGAYAPAVAEVDAYLPAGTVPATCPTPVPPGAGCSVPTVDTAVLVPDPTDPAVPLVPITAPPAPVLSASPMLGSQAHFVRLHWNVAVTPSQPTVLTYRVRVPVPAAGSRATEELLVVSGSVTPALVPAPAGQLATTAAPASPSEVSTVHHFTWPVPVAPGAPPVVMTTTTLTPPTTLAPVPLRRSAVAAAVISIAGSQPLSAAAPVPTAAGITTTATTPTTVPLLPVSAATRNPFLAPGQKELSLAPAATAGPAATPRPVATTVPAAPTRALAQTGADVASELLDGLVLVVGGGAAAALATDPRRAFGRRRGAHFPQR